MTIHVAISLALIGISANLIFFSLSTVYFKYSHNIKKYQQELVETIVSVQGKNVRWLEKYIKRRCLSWNFVHLSARY
jgi:hypothetical protein